jgi:hypothetical protein
MSRVEEGWREKGIDHVAPALAFYAMIRGLEHRGVVYANLDFIIQFLLSH